MREEENLRRGEFRRRNIFRTEFLASGTRIWLDVHSIDLKGLRHT